MNIDKVMELKERAEKVLGYEVHNLLGNPALELIHALVSKIEGGESNGNEPTTDITTSDAVASTETKASTTESTAGSEPTTGSATNVTA